MPNTKMIPVDIVREQIARARNSFDFYPDDEHRRLIQGTLDYLEKNVLRAADRRDPSNIEVMAK